MTSQPIVMWLGNSSSPARLLPWPSISKQWGVQSEHHIGLEVEVVEPGSAHFYPYHKKTAASQSQFRTPSSKKGRPPYKKKKGDRGPRKHKKKGKGKKGKGKWHRKKQPPQKTPQSKGYEEKSSHEPGLSTARRAKSTTSGMEDERASPPGAGRHQKPTTREHQRHRHHGDGEKPGTKHHRNKSGKHTETTSFMWTTLNKLSSMFTPADREQEDGRTGESESPRKRTSKHDKHGHHKHGKGHPTSSTHETTGGTHRRHSTHVTSKATGHTAHNKKHKTKHGRPSASLHHEKTTATRPLSSSSPSVTKGDHNGRKSTKKETEGSIQPGSTAEQALGLGLEEETVEEHATKMRAPGRSNRDHSKEHRKSTPEFKATVDLTTGETRQERKAHLSSSHPEGSGSPSSGGKGHKSALSMTTKSGAQSEAGKKSSGGARKLSLASTTGEGPEGSSTAHSASKQRRRRHHKHRHRHDRHADWDGPPGKGSRGKAHGRQKAGLQLSKFLAPGGDKQPSKKLPLMLRTIPIKAPEE